MNLTLYKFTGNLSNPCTPGLILEVCCSREVAAGFQGTSDNRAKVGICFVMLVGGREIIYRYVKMDISWKRRPSRALYFI